MAPQLPNFMKNINSPRISMKLSLEQTHTQKSTPRHILVNCLNIKNKENLQNYQKNYIQGNNKIFNS